MENTNINPSHKGQVQDTDKSELQRVYRMKAKYQKSLAVKELQDIAYRAKIDRYPDFPYPIKSMYRDDTSNGLTACIIDYLRLQGYQSERINSTGRQVKKNGEWKWINGSCTKGTADISATIAGKSVKIEVKIGKDRQSDYQKRYQRSIESAGGIYYIARNFSDFMTWYNLKFVCHE